MDLQDNVLIFLFFSSFFFFLMFNFYFGSDVGVFFC